MSRIGWIRTTVLSLLGFLVAAGWNAGPAAASNPSITECPSNVTTNPDGTFSFTVTVTNTGNPGDVELHGAGSSNISGLEIHPDHHVFETGEEFSFTVSGTLNGSNGTVNVHLSHVTDAGQIIKSTPGIVGRPKLLGFKVNITHG